MNTPLKIILCLAIYAGFVFSATAQKIHVAGKVTTVNGTRIAGVHVFDSTANLGTTSDINGIFNLTIPKKVSKLRFSHIAFNPQYISLTQKRLDTITANTIWLDVVLTPKVRELPVAEISDAKIQIAYKNSKQWILDYEPVGTDEFLLLLLEKNKKYLQLVNSNHEKVSQIVVDKDYNQLFKDCFGYFHLLSRDSACQAFLVDAELMLDYYNTRQDFNRILDPIVANTGNYLYTKSYSRYNQLVSYEKINKETKEMIPLVENFAEKRAHFNRSYFFTDVLRVFIECNEDLATPEIRAVFYSIVTNAKNTVEVFRLRWMLYPADLCWAVLDKIATYKASDKPPYSLLTTINDTLYFFDHLNSLIAAYDLDGNYLREVPTNYHNNKGWDKEIIVNEEKTRCFAKFTRDGETSLIEINPNTGQMIGKYVLEAHAFPTKIKVRGNDIYYLSKDYFEREQKYFLWRQKME